MEKFEFKDLDRIEKREIEGVWFEYQSGFEVKVARYGNAKFQAALRKTSKAEVDQINLGGEISPETVTAFMAREKEAVAEFILIDWKGIYDNGKEIPYTTKKGKEALSRECFYREVVEFSNQFERFKIVGEDKDSKN